MENDEIKVHQYILGRRRLRSFVSFASLIRSQGSFENARRFRVAACRSGLATRCNKTAYRSSGLIWTDEARRLQKQKHIN